MFPYVIRYPKSMLVIAVLFVGIPMAELRMAIEHKGHWTGWHVLIWGALTLWFVGYVAQYRSVMTADDVEQRVFPWRVRRLRYDDIATVKMISAGAGFALRLSPITGKAMKINGATARLIQAQEILYDKIPRAYLSLTFANKRERLSVRRSETTPAI